MRLVIPNGRVQNAEADELYASRALELRTKPISKTRRDTVQTPVRKLRPPCPQNSVGPGPIFCRAAHMPLTAHA